MNSAQMQTQGREYTASMLAGGQWAKTGKHEYTRVTGEVVTKTRQGWQWGNKVWGAACHALYAVETKYKAV